MSDFIVRDDMSRLGLHRRHLVSVMLPVDRDLALAEITTQGVVIQAILEYKDEDTEVHHLHIYWRPEEA